MGCRKKVKDGRAEGEGKESLAAVEKLARRLLLKFKRRPEKKRKEKKENKREKNYRKTKALKKLER